MVYRAIVLTLALAGASYAQESCSDYIDYIFAPGIEYGEDVSIDFRYENLDQEAVISAARGFSEGLVFYLTDRVPNAMKPYIALGAEQWNMLYGYRLIRVIDEKSNARSLADYKSVGLNAIDVQGPEECRTGIFNNRPYAESEVDGYAQKPLLDNDLSRGLHVVICHSSGAVFNAGKVIHLTAHQVGHTLGFGHSSDDQPGAPSVMSLAIYDPRRPDSRAYGFSINRPRWLLRLLKGGGSRPVPYGRMGLIFTPYDMVALTCTHDRFGTFIVPEGKRILHDLVNPSGGYNELYPTIANVVHAGKTMTFYDFSYALQYGLLGNMWAWEIYENQSYDSRENVRSIAASDAYSFRCGTE